MKSEKLKIILLIFSVVFITYFLSRNITSFDSAWCIHTAMSILKEGNTNLDEYASIISEQDHRVRKIDGHLYMIYPIGTVVIAVPFVFVADNGLKVILSAFPQLEGYIRKYLRSRSSSPLPDVINVITIYLGMELLIASFVVALAAVFLYCLARLYLGAKGALLITFIFAFCTSAWSVASRGLWQHGPSMLMLTIALYLILSAKNRPSWVQFAGVPLAFSYVIRPINVISFVLLSFYVLLQYRSYFLRYLLWAMTVAIPLSVFTFAVYHTLLPRYYTSLAQRIGSNPHFLEALVANLFSPARGLFIFSPVLIFSIFGVIAKLGNREFDLLDYLLSAVLILHWVLISSFFVWWAGWSFGPRFFSDVIPYFIYFLIFFLSGICQWEGIRKRVVVAAFVCFIAISFFIHYRGSNKWETYDWNSEPVNVDLKPSRVWDWRDIQFFRGIED